MPTATETRASRAFVVLNPASGNATPEDVRQALAKAFEAEGAACEVHETAEGEDLVAAARAAVGRGADLVVAAGGDGTVSTVAAAVVGTPTPLGIIPLGTTNVLARELNLPLDLDAACALLAGEHDVVAADAMKVGDNYYYTQIGIGVDALMIRDTTTESKKRFGGLAYMWTAATHLIGFEPRRFSIVADEQKLRPRASQVLLINSGTMGTTPFRWGPDSKIDDGRVEVCIVRARTVIDYVIVGGSFVLGRQRRDRNLRYMTAAQVVAVTSDKPLPVQGDGELIGRTPVTVEVVPGALRVVVPRADQ